MSPVAQYLDALSPASRVTQVYGLRRVLRVLELEGDVLTFDWSLMTPEHVDLVVSRLSERYAPATVRLTLAALRRVLYLSGRTREAPPHPPLGREPGAHPRF